MLCRFVVVLCNVSLWPCLALRLVAVCRPCWGCFSQQAKNVTTAAHLERQTATRASDGSWASELHDLVINGFFQVGGLLYPTTLNDKDEAVNLHFRVLIRLLEKRVQSLSAYYLKPPLRYAGALLSEHEGRVLQQMDREWSMILEAEKALASGAHVPPLQAMHWRLPSVNRLLCLLNERAHLTDAGAQAASDDKASALHLLKLCCRHLGDTRVIENSHQMMKDAGLW